MDATAAGVDQGPQSPPRRASPTQEPVAEALAPLGAGGGLVDTGAAAKLPPAEKQCGGCQQWKPRADFLRMAKNADGLSHQCKACLVKAPTPTVTEKECSKCKHTKPACERTPH
jgi:hypothetical protein